MGIWKSYTRLLSLNREWLSSTRLDTRGFKQQTCLRSGLDYDEARQWFKRFNSVALENDIGEVTYSRSSGPGGQNVNKVNSKAQLRVPLAKLLPLVPSALHNGIKKSQYYAGKTESLLIQADDSRKQSANRDTCYRKLHELLVEVFYNTVPGETSDEQKEKVKNLQRSENEARLKRKKLRSDKKASRSKSWET